VRRSFSSFALAALLLAAPASVARGPKAIRPLAQAALAIPDQGETRALLVTVGGETQFEHYRPGFGAETRFVSWSMAKTVTAVALGMLVDEGKLDIDQPAPVALWRIATDGRETITTRHLLTMTSGLRHTEGNERGLPVERADTVRLLFTDGAQSAAAYAIAQPLAKKPGTHWQYSTATTHILADIVTGLVTSSREPAERRRVMVAWFKQRLWDPLGITSAEWDFDNAGLFLGGSMLHMTARDYAKLGQFMLDGGKTRDGRALVSPAWHKVLLTKAAAANNNHYAGQLWLNTGPAEGQPPVLMYPKGGQDSYGFIGHLGQYIIVVPKARAVVVRLGKTPSAQRVHARAALTAIVDPLVAD
jgi:CubicO group peptidase (beta-lactamase class C family)